MEGYYVGQLILVGVLVLITGYYAIQTHRQVNLLKEQLDESSKARTKDEKIASLDRISSWATDLINALLLPDMQERIDIAASLAPFLSKVPSVLADTMKFDDELKDEFRKASTAVHKYVTAIQQGTDIKKLLPLVEDLTKCLYSLNRSTSKQRLML